VPGVKICRQLFALLLVNLITQRQNYNEKMSKKQFGGLPPPFHPTRMAGQLNGAVTNSYCF